jgi:hypothetical protein
LDRFATCSHRRWLTCLLATRHVGSPARADRRFLLSDKR